MTHPNIQSEDGEKLETLKYVLFDLVDKHFPKHQCKERGAAMVLVAEALLAIEETYAKDKP